MNLEPHANIRKRIVLGVDIGTTNIRCYAYDHSAKVMGYAQEKVPLLVLEDGQHEIEPDLLWNAFQNVIKQCLLHSQLNADEISCLGISTQRSTFLTWNKSTGENFHNFITWKDKRSQKLCEEWNSSLSFKLRKFGLYILYLVSQKKEFQLGSVFKFTSAMVLPRLCWLLKQNRKIKENILSSDALFGTIDTWLVWKLTGGKVHATDASNACVTGFFDQFTVQWAEWILQLFQIPSSIFPCIKDTSDFYGETLPEIFGVPIPICALVGDQQAALFGTGCFNRYDINCTMGTGSFLKMNTGSSPTFAPEGIYPLVGWRISSNTTYYVECGVYDVGTVLSFAQNLGLFHHPEETIGIAQSVPDSDNVYFLPGSTSLKVAKHVGTSAFIGLKEQTSKAHLVRSILEAIAFQVCFLFETVSKYYGIEEDCKFRICGGVAKNDFILQLISDITKKHINRLQHNECSSLGAAFLAGLYSGFWKDQAEINALLSKSKAFSPSALPTAKTENAYLNWKKAVNIL